MSIFRIFLVFLVALLGAGAGPAIAQSQTTATFEDWILRCDLRAGSPPQRLCEVLQTTQVQGQGVLSQITIVARKGEPMRLAIQVPIDVWLPTGVRLTLGEKDPGLSAIFKRCVPNACIADLEIREDTIKKLRTATEPGKLQFKDANQKEVSLPVSFKGFGQAFDAMPKD